MRMPQDRQFLIPCQGGCDFTAPVWNQPPGLLKECRNMEVGIAQGYISSTGYERFDGRPSPSAATYTYLFIEVTGEVEVGDTVLGTISAATGLVIAMEAGGIVVTQVVGDFQDGEGIEVSGVEEGVLTSSPIMGYAKTQREFLRYRALAANAYRLNIGAVPGSGPIRGVCRFRGVLYAWRDDAAGDAMVIHKSTASGWSAVALGSELAFTAGAVEIFEGDTVTGATSGATAVVKRVVLTTGDWDDSDAAGKLIFESQTGVFEAEDLDIGSSTSVATIAGDSNAITLAPGGRVSVVIENFAGQLGTLRIYGCDGVNRGFEFDGNVYVPIDTGMGDADKPTNVIAHKFHLFFSFDSSAQHSGTGYPYKWSPVFGAAEIASGDTITAFSIERGSEQGAALAILCRNSASILYGNDDADWVLIRLRKEVGAYAHSVQDMGIMVALDDRGIGSLRAVDAYGNFTGSTLSQKVQDWIQSKKRDVVASCIVREKSQYRVFFGDKSAIYTTFLNNEVLGMTTIELKHQPTCIHSVEGESGVEEIFMGGDDGYCYQMERGTSFDGLPIDYYGVLQYSHCGSPRVNKSFKGAAIEMSGSNFTEFALGWELGYSSSYIHQPNRVSSMAELSRPRWDLGNWDVGFWDGQAVAPQVFKLCGTAENISFIISGNSTDFDPIMISGVMVRYQPRRILR